MKRALVTGGAGFIGSHLVARLVAEGQEVVVLDNLTRPSRDRMAALANLSIFEFYTGDIRDRAAVAQAVRGCDVIYHLAAQSNVIGALEDPEYSFTTNVTGTYNVLRAAVEGNVRRLVFTSSREVYGEAQYTPVDELHPLDAKNPYGASKVAGEAYCRTFANCHGLDVAIVRLANVFGPGDTDRVIPLWLGEAAAGRDLRVFGGEQVLDFVWVDTVIDMLTLAGARGLPGPANVGSGIGTPILELARRITEVTPTGSSVARVAPREAEVKRFVADVSQMRRLGIEPDADPLRHLAGLAARYQLIEAF